LRIAEAHYEQAIAGMQQIVTAEQGSLDPALAATLQKNMGVIDQAIRESREAIKTQPHSELVRTSLFEALRQKVALLEETIALINVMRKGDQAGAARIITGLSKS
jgi:signal transduction histidine kinase